MNNIMFIGTLGSGMTLRAREIANSNEAHTRYTKFIGDSSRILRLAGLGESNSVPFRAPHHTVSEMGIVGKLVNGWCPTPGEASLAHGGILFLDQVEEFRKSVIDLVLKALDRKYIVMGGSNAHIEIPSDFTLVVAATPCPCGYYGSTRRSCSCSQLQIDKWTAKHEQFRKVCKVVEMSGGGK